MTGNENELLSEETTAAYFGLRVATLRNWRCLRQGPAWVKVGRRAFYRREAILKWIVSRESGGR
jgi:hypothetical protein